jgi:hypothetical protein
MSFGKEVRLDYWYDENVENVIDALSTLSVQLKKDTGVPEEPVFREDGRPCDAGDRERLAWEIDQDVRRYRDLINR